MNARLNPYLATVVLFGVVLIRVCTVIVEATSSPQLEIEMESQSEVAK